jgi:hypothetical protein
MKINILSHRGYWKSSEEKNLRTAFERSFSLGFGTETDLRDLYKKLVVSHDIPDESAMTGSEFFEIYRQYSSELTLALNVKSDGLQKILWELLKKFNIENYFVFDMSVPDGLQYIKQGGFNVFTRQSEYEKEPSFYDQAQGVWMDMFVNDWIEEKDIEKHLEKGKKICIVSPDLHKRNHLPFWEKLSKMSVAESKNLMLCTDFPEEAKKLFYGYY